MPAPQNFRKNVSKIKTVLVAKLANRSKNSHPQRGMAMLAMLGRHGQDARATVFTVEFVDRSEGVGQEKTDPGASRPGFEPSGRRLEPHGWSQVKHRRAYAAPLAKTIARLTIRDWNRIAFLLPNAERFVTRKCFERSWPMLLDILQGQFATFALGLRPCLQGIADLFRVLAFAIETQRQATLVVGERSCQLGPELSEELFFLLIVILQNEGDDKQCRSLTTTRATRATRTTRRLEKLVSHRLDCRVCPGFGIDAVTLRVRLSRNASDYVPGDCSFGLGQVCFYVELAHRRCPLGTHDEIAAVLGRQHEHGEGRPGRGCAAACRLRGAQDVSFHVPQPGRCLFGIDPITQISEQRQRGGSVPLIKCAAAQVELNGIRGRWPPRTGSKFVDWPGQLDAPLGSYDEIATGLGRQHEDGERGPGRDCAAACRLRGAQNASFHLL